MGFFNKGEAEYHSIRTLFPACRIIGRFTHAEMSKVDPYKQETESGDVFEELESKIVYNWTWVVEDVDEGNETLIGVPCVIQSSSVLGGPKSTLRKIIRGILGCDPTEGQFYAFDPEDHYLERHSIMLAVNEFQGKQFNEIVSFKNLGRGILGQ